jgi:hypothetical protein
VLAGKGYTGAGDHVTNTVFTANNGSGTVTALTG